MNLRAQPLLGLAALVLAMVTFTAVRSASGKSAFEPAPKTAEAPRAPERPLVEQEVAPPVPVVVPVPAQDAARATDAVRGPAVAGSPQNLSDVVTEGRAASPSLLRWTPRTRAERVDVWERFQELDLGSQLALQDRLAPDYSGPRLERIAGTLRVVAAPSAASILWVSEERGYLGSGVELQVPSGDLGGEVRAIFVRRGDDGSTLVTSSRPLGVN